MAAGPAATGGVRGSVDVIGCLDHPWGGALWGVPGADEIGCFHLLPYGTGAQQATLWAGIRFGNGGGAVA